MNELSKQKDQLRQSARNKRHSFSEKYIEESFPKLLDFAIDVILAIVVFAIGTRVIKWLVKIIKSSMERANLEQGVLTFISSLIRSPISFLFSFTYVLFRIDLLSYLLQCQLIRKY